MADEDKILTVIDYVIKAVSIVMEAAKTIEQARSLWKTQESLIEAMKAEGRDPTQAEWDTLFALELENSAELQA